VGLLRVLRWVWVLVAVAIALGGRAAHAQGGGDAGAAVAAPDSWAGQLEGLARWAQQHRQGGRCSEQCYSLDRLRVTGALGEGLRFELTGSVWADGAFAVPLFGPPAQVRLEGVTLDGKEAPISFEKDHYYLFTAARRFVLKGTLFVDGDLAVVIAGPLNTFEADVTGGRVVEGTRMSGLKDATIHFSREGGRAESSGPTVFQLSRAVRVGREIGFEYRLVMRSGTDLGVVRLPLPFGEKVLEVTGANGWRVEGEDLVLPASGRSAEMKITGTLQKVASFTPDTRSGYEWWLLESDAEHRITVKGDARQLDSAESPIARTQASSRLFLVQKGQRIEVTVQPLASVDVLAAVVRRHDRTIVLTHRGDLVSDDTLSYENNGIDYLLYAPGGRPIYLATDGKAERIMHQGQGAKEVLVPLQTGSHAVRSQALGETEIKGLGGWIELPMPSYPLTASRVGLSVGLPARVWPVGLLGGDRPHWFVDSGDAVAIVLGFVAAWIAVRPDPGTTRRVVLRLLGGLVMAGLWFFWPGGFVFAIVALCAAALVWLATRFMKGAPLVLATLAVLGAVGLVGLVSMVLVSGRAPMRGSSEYAVPSEQTVSPAPSAGDKGDRTGNFLAQTAAGGVLEGVTPVALTLPSYERHVAVSRELVTRDRPFRPILLYVTDWALAPIGLLWLGALLIVLSAHRNAIRGAYGRIRQRLTQRPGGTATG
jgi:hypothetical protein